MSTEKALLLGNEAVARGAWEAGVTVVSSYPGTPSTEITECISKYDEIYSEWAPNEKVAAEVVSGASFAGSRAMCCMKHVGLNVAADPLFTVSYTGVNGGLVFVVADDPGMFSSQNEQDSRYYGLSAHVPVLEPSDSQECVDFIKLAFSISETFDTPVIFRLTTRVAHQRSAVALSDRISVPKKKYEKNVQKYVMMPAMARKRHVIVEKRMAELELYSEGKDGRIKGVNIIDKAENDGKKLGIITSGISYQYVKEVFPDKSVLKIGISNPLPKELIKSFASEYEEVLIVEELEPYIENFARQIGIKNIKGKEIFSRLGELGTAAIRKAYYGQEPLSETITEAVDVPPRPPLLCAGCPHRGIFYTLSKMDVRVCGDIGCYSLGAQPPYERIDAVLCMGASISMSHGMEKADMMEGNSDKKPTVAVIGDSTFMHSGITSLIDVVYNKGASTVIILDNSITGMTGHQQNPTTGFTIKNEPAPAVNLIKLCEAIGIKRVTVKDPFDLKGMRQAIEEELSADEPSVIISQRPCALLKKVNYGGPMKIDTSKCKRCGKCMTLGCPAIIKSGDAYEIDQTQCVGCGLCAGMCAFGSIGK